MVTLSKAMLGLSMGFGSVLMGYGQQVALSPDNIARCTHWINETVPSTVRVVGSDFCRGIKHEGSPDQWFSIEKCGEQSGSKNPERPMFCSSSGAVGPDTAVAVGYSGMGGDGGELLSAMEGSKAAAVLYSRTPLHIGNVRVPSGLAQLTFSHDDERGWQMIIKPDGEKVASTVRLLSDTQRLSATGSELAIGVRYASPRCTDFFNMRELVFTYGATDLYVCVLPERAPPISDESAMR